MSISSDKLTLQEFFDHAFRELYSLEEMLESFGQQQTADVLRSVVEMVFAKLNDAGAILERDIGQLSILINEFGEPSAAEITMKSTVVESFH